MEKWQGTLTLHIGDFCVKFTSERLDSHYNAYCVGRKIPDWCLDFDQFKYYTITRRGLVFLNPIDRTLIVKEQKYLFTIVAEYFHVEPLTRNDVIMTLIEKDSLYKLALRSAIRGYKDLKDVYQMLPDCPLMEEIIRIIEHLYE